MKNQNISTSLENLEQYFSDNKRATSLINQLKAIYEGKEQPVVVSSSNSAYPIPGELSSTTRDAYALFSDGACRGNPGPGSWGSMGQNNVGDLLFEASGVDLQTTNNKMELTGAIEALKQLKNKITNLDNAEIWLYSDSKYVVTGLNEWVSGWKKRGWKKADKKEPENLELWQELDQWRCDLGEYLHLVWVKGHSGHPQNERCDQMANEALDQALGR